MKRLLPQIRFLLFNLLAAFIVICGIGYYVLSGLNSYTRHDYSIAVPDFYGFTPEEAMKLATQEQLRIQVVDSLYDEEAKPGTIVEQSPSTDSRVKENRLVYLTMNAHNPEKIAFPNLRNAAYRHTLQTLESRGFAIGRIEYIPSEFKNLVVGLRYKQQDIQTGEMLPKGATIDIVLGSGKGNNTVQVPRLYGKKLREAIEVIRKSFLNIGYIKSDGSVSNGNEKYEATIYVQSPGENTRVEAGSSVDLEITTKKEKIMALDSLIVTE